MAHIEPYQWWICGLGATWWVAKLIVIWRYCRTQRKELTHVAKKA